MGVGKSEAQRGRESCAESHSQAGSWFGNLGELTVVLCCVAALHLPG